MKKFAPKVRALVAKVVRNHQLSIALMAALAVPFSLLWNSTLAPGVKGIEPILDRIDLHVEAPALAFAELRSPQTGEPSERIRGRVEAARDRQRARFAGARLPVNARMTQAQIREHCAVDRAMGDLLQQAMERLSLSARAYDRILKVSRTIADLAGAEKISSPHLLEAIQYRSLDRNLSH